MTTVRVFFAIGASLGWSIRQFDVHNAFLNGDLAEDIYMSLPPGLRFQGATAKPPMVCKLHKSLYGLKQASRTWNSTFTQALLDIGFTQSKADYSLYTRRTHEGFVALLVYVDDILVGSSSEALIEDVRNHLFGKFKTRDLGEVKYFLGLEVARSEKGIHLCQRKYTLEILEEVGMKGCKVATTPIEQNHKLRKHEESPLEDATSYRKLVGKLIYLSITRPDIAYAVNVLSQFMSSPQKDHMDAVFRVLRYLKSTVGRGILLSSKSELKLRGYSDSDWAACPDTRRSTTGYCIFIGESMVSWRTKKQVTVSRSSTEAEYRALAHTTAEMTWLRYLLEDFGIVKMESSQLWCDNQAAIYLTKNPVFHERTKHVEIDCHFVREKFLEGLIQPMHVSTGKQLADAFTKALPSSTLDFLFSNMGMVSIHSHIEGKCQNASLDDRTSGAMGRTSVNANEMKMDVHVHGMGACEDGPGVHDHGHELDDTKEVEVEQNSQEGKNAWKTRYEENMRRKTRSGVLGGKRGARGGDVHGKMCDDVADEREGVRPREDSDRS